MFYRLSTHLCNLICYDTFSLLLLFLAPNLAPSHPKVWVGRCNILYDKEMSKLSKHCIQSFSGTPPQESHFPLVSWISEVYPKMYYLGHISVKIKSLRMEELWTGFWPFWCINSKIIMQKTWFYRHQKSFMLIQQYSSAIW